MSKIVPTVGRIVLFTLADEHADAINRRRDDATAHRHKHDAGHADGSQSHVGNRAATGDILPAVVVRVWGSEPDSAINLKVMLDGSDDLWVTSASVEPDKGVGENGEAIHTPGGRQQIALVRCALLLVGRRRGRLSERWPAERASARRTGFRRASHSPFKAINLRTFSRIDQ